MKKKKMRERKRKAASFPVKNVDDTFSQIPIPQSISPPFSRSSCNIPLSYGANMWWRV